MTRHAEPFPSGFLLLNKPKDISSFAAINSIKKLLPRKTKVGHAGTLDNFATGLLIVAVGRQATREIKTLMNLDKTYSVRAKLGERTDTLDYTGTIIEKKELENISAQTIAQAIASLGSSYEQIPPIFSALKFQGDNLYALARSKKLSHQELESIVKHKSRTVELYDVTLESYTPPYFSFSAHVSKGTYIRCLANDIASNLGSIATTYDLLRTSIGPYLLDEAQELSSFKDRDDVRAHLIPIEQFTDRV